MRRRLLAVVLSLVAANASAGQAQTPPPAPPQGALRRVYLDCGPCDTDFLRRNVAFVDYVRDRAQAEVHVLVTTQGTGGGGRSWTLKYIGLEQFRDQDRTLTFTTSQTATNDEQREEFARVFRLGLVGYAANTPAGPELDVSWKKPAQPKTAVKDPWNYWVFRANATGNVNSERSSSSNSSRFGFSGNRTTAAWKLTFSTNGDVNHNSFLLSDEETVKSTSTNWSVNGRAVKSMGPKFSIGLESSASHSSFSNNKRTVSVTPALEYDVFPYADWERRSLTIQYVAGADARTYAELTVFDKLSETVPWHSLMASLKLRQPWGSLEVEGRVGQQLNKLSRYHSSIEAGTDVNLFKGFSFNISGEYNRIRDQIGLRKGPASTEDILLRLKQLATGYSYEFNVGFSYSFGSIFNNVVNTRFGGGEGFVIFF